MKTKPKNTPGPLVPEWKADSQGRITAVRDAQFWKALPNGAVECTLCYRNCVLQRGETGWCGYRGNTRGAMVLHEHGVLARLQRQIIGYSGGFRTYCPGALALGIGATRCTARCTFCTSANIVWEPARIPWLGDRPRGLGAAGGWYNVRSMAHPAGVVANALRIRATHLVFAENEPMLSWEFTYDTARLAKRAGLRVLLYTNGLSTPDAIRKLAPYVDAVDLGIKGALDPGFYAHWTKSPEAVEYVKAAALAWKAAGVFLGCSDLIPTQYMLNDADLSEAQARVYDWIASALGEDTTVLQGHMHRPDTGGRVSDLLVRAADAPAYWERYCTSKDRARAAGLHYAHQSAADERITCRHCDGLLLQICAPVACTFEPCALHLHYCTCWSHAQHATNGRCDHCGASVPLVTLSPAEVTSARADANALADEALADGRYATARVHR